MACLYLFLWRWLNVARKLCPSSSYNNASIFWEEEAQWAETKWRGKTICRLCFECGTFISVIFALFLSPSTDGRSRTLDLRLRVKCYSSIPLCYRVTAINLCFNFCILNVESSFEFCFFLFFSSKMFYFKLNRLFYSFY